MNNAYEIFILCGKQHIFLLVPDLSWENHYELYTNSLNPVQGGVSNISALQRLKSSPQDEFVTCENYTETLTCDFSIRASAIPNLSTGHFIEPQRFTFTGQEVT